MAHIGVYFQYQIQRILKHDIQNVSKSKNLVKNCSHCFWLRITGKCYHFLQVSLVVDRKSSSEKNKSSEKAPKRTQTCFPWWVTTIPVKQAYQMQVCSFIKGELVSMKNNVWQYFTIMYPLNAVTMYPDKLNSWNQCFVIFLIFFFKSSYFRSFDILLL